MRLDHVPRLVRTVRHLRSSQLWWRTRYLVERKLPLLPGRHTSAVPQAVPLREEGVPWIAPFHRLGPTGNQAVECLLAGDFHHLGRTVRIGRDDPDWERGGAQAGRLWQITLHYHGWVYDLAEAAVQGDARALPLLQHYLEHWLAACRLHKVGADSLIWNSFAIATRLGWWVRALELLRRGQAALPPDFILRWQHSLSRQAQYLSHHLEWDLRANHLLRDAVGLAWAGRYLAGRAADRWLKLAGELADSQAVEQVLPDGGHFERSPMYHIHVLEDFLTLERLVTNVPAQRRLRETCLRMAEFCRWLRHPDGTLPLFNDGAHGAVSLPGEILERMAHEGWDVPQTMPRGLKHFEQTGLLAWHDNPWTLFWDVGDVGPGYQPGHAHADTLTLECSFQGRRLIVDPGTYGYDRDDRRRYDRATAAHNTVCVDQADSSEVWHIFRVGARAKPLGVDVIPRRSGFTAWAAHTGYDRRPGSPRHARQLSVEERRVVRIVDQVQGHGCHHLEGGWLLAPEWQPQQLASGWYVRSGTDALRIRIDTQHPVHLSIEPRPWHPEYGVERNTQRLVWRCQHTLPFEMVTTWEPVG
uniref:Alginate lyase family protein n=1 Tax=Schlesneria paludicola TaxID=360056 RepID=A0A7C4QPH3_9PLAN